MRAASLITILQETIVNIMLKELAHLVRLSYEYDLHRIYVDVPLLWCESEPIRKASSETSNKTFLIF